VDERPGVAGRRAIAVVVPVLLAVTTACTGTAGTEQRTVPAVSASTATSTSVTARPSSPTSASAGDPLVLIASGDIACAAGSAPTATRCHQRTTATLLTAGPGAHLTAVLLLGDTQYESGRSDEYASFEATWGDALGSTTGTDVLPVAGNHEWYDPDPPGGACTFVHDGRNACGFEAYFGDQAFAGTRTDGAGNYVRIFAEQAAHPLVVIMIDAGVCEHDPTVCGARGSATQFLRSVLGDPQTNPPGACTIVAWHQARWSDVGHGSIGYVDPLWRALFSVPAVQRPDLVLNGHDHVYERMPALGTGGQPSAGGIPEIIAGAGGREIAGVPYAGALPTRAAYLDLQHFGVLRIEHEPTAGRLATSFLTETQVAVDRQDLTCRA